MYYITLHIIINLIIIIIRYITYAWRWQKIFQGKTVLRRISGYRAPNFEREGKAKNKDRSLDPLAT